MNIRDKESQAYFFLCLFYLLFPPFSFILSFFFHARVSIISLVQNILFLIHTTDYHHGL